MEQVILGRDEFAALAGDLLGSGHALRFTARGASMTPFIRDGDVLTVRPIDGAALRVGNVALYRAAGGGLIAHRVVGKTHRNGQTLLSIRGDASRGPADSVRPEQVLGQVICLQRGHTIVQPHRGWLRLAARLWPWLARIRCAVRRLPAI